MSAVGTHRLETVLSLWRYPVKSMMGEELNASALDEVGLVGDRSLALVDTETGQVASAKNPKKWPEFFAYRASYSGPLASRNELPPVWIQCPDGSVVSTSEKNVGEVLSRSLCRAVQVRSRAPGSASLEQYWPEREPASDAGAPGEPSVTQEKIAGDAPPGTFFDYAVVHLLTTATLEALQRLHPAGRIESRRFRPNIIVQSDPGAQGFVENQWVGRILSIGPDVLLQVSDPCPRCIMPTLAQGDLPKDSGIMRAMTANTVYVPFAQKPLASIGVYAKVLNGGTVRRGDRVEVAGWARGA